MTETLPMGVAVTGLSGLVGQGIEKCSEDILMLRNLGADLTQVEAVDRAVGESAENIVLNLAAFTDTNAAWAQRNDREGLCYQLNVCGAANLANSCKKYGKLLIHVSTDCVYDGAKEGIYTEEDPVNAIDWYGYTKCLAEEAVLGTNKVNAVVRISSPFLSGRHPKKEDLISKLARQIQNRTLPPQFIDSLFVPTWVDDFSGAITAVAQSRASGIFNGVGTTATSPYELAHKVAEIYNLDPDQIACGSLSAYLEQSDRPYARRLHLSNKKIQEQLGVHFTKLDTALAIVARQNRSK